MCKGDGGRVLSNVELILPWNVVEACYTLERNDSTCFFAANDSEGTTSQISLCKLEDNSVKIQVTVTALEGDENEQEELEGPSTAERDASKHKKFTLWGSDEDPSDRTPSRHQKRIRPELDFGNEVDQYPGVDTPASKKFRPRPRHVSQLKPTLMNKSLTAMWRRKKRRARQQVAAALARKGRLGKPGFNLKQARSILEKKGVLETARRTYGTEAMMGRSYQMRGRGREEPAMPVLEAVEGEDQEIDLDLIYKYGAQMRAFEARRRQEKANWEKVQAELKHGKEGVSMVIVLKGEGEEEVPKVYEETPEVTPKLHVIEPLPTEVEPQRDNPENLANPMNDEDLSTQVIYIHTQSKDGVEAEDIDEGKKFFKRRRDKATRVAKDNGSSKGKPLWKQQMTKKAFKIEPDRPAAPVDCVYCPRKFKDYSYLFRHVKGHHMDMSDAAEYLEELKPKMKVNCPICDKTISSMANVSNHIKQCHPDQDTAVKCDLCDKTYKTPASLKQHIRQRHLATSKKYECAQCNMVFAERRGLTDHVNCVHETTQVFTCNKCWKVFLTKSRLRRHMYIHGEHRHICKECGKGFHIKDNMNKHIRIVHEKNHGKMWKCSYCSKEFLVKGNMTQHIRGIHLKQFPFTCSKCQQGFRRMRDMMLHMEKCNEEGNVSIEMFPKDVKEETPKRSGKQNTETPRRSTRSRRSGGRSKRAVTPPDSEEEEDQEEYVIHDEMVVTGDEEDEEEEYENEDVETREVILNSNGGEDSMQLQIEQDGVVIPIEVVIGQNEGETEGAEVIADGTVA